MSLNKATADLVSDMLGAKASPVDLANAAASANEGKVRDAVVSAADGFAERSGQGELLTLEEAANEAQWRRIA